jgi:hypothetical protein
MIEFSFVQDIKDWWNRTFRKDNEIIIKIANNGCMLKTYEGDLIYKFDDEHPEDLVDMLYELRNMLVCSSKYSEKRIEIKTIHGEKFECKDRECEICNENN